MSAVERWDSFLAQIEGRHRAVREEAAKQARAAVATLASPDTSFISHGWAAIESRLQELEKRIADTWSEKVDDTFAAEGIVKETRMAALEKGDALRFTLENAREELQQHIFADAARELFARAMANRRDRYCSECGAQFELPMCFRAIDLTCPRCGTRTQFEPGELMRGAAAVGVHALSQEAALAEWLAMRKAERRAKAVRPPCPLALLKEYERAQIAYWRVYVAARARLEPELGRDPALEVRSRMEFWYTYSAEHEPEWVRGGRPREAIS